MPLKKIVKQTFDQSDVHIDGHEYVDCVFQHCNIRFSASRPFDMSQSKLGRNVMIFFEKHAHLTLWFLSYLYRIPGQRPLVEKIFQDIRDHKFDNPEETDWYKHDYWY